MAVACGVLLAACSPVKLVNAFVPHRDYALHGDVPYESGDPHTLDVYVPTASTHTTKKPLVVFFLRRKLAEWQSRRLSVRR